MEQDSEEEQHKGRGVATGQVRRGRTNLPKDEVRANHGIRLAYQDAGQRLQLSCYSCQVAFGGILSFCTAVPIFKLPRTP